MVRGTTSTHGSSASAKVTTKKRPTRHRKRSVRTSDTRKAEIAQLLQKSALLQQQLTRLQRTVAGASASSEASLEQSAIENALVREQLRNHQFFVAGLKSAMAADTSEHIPSPVSSTLRLGTDPAQRWAFLRSVKPQKIHDARQFFRRRTQLMDMTRPFSEATQFQAPSGEVCAAKLDVFPLADARSVKEVYDTLLFYALNVEMCTAEMNGDVVVREEAETGDESVSQNRFVFSTTRGVQLEANNILFCEYTPPRAKAALIGGSSGLLGLGGEHESDELDPSDEGLITLDFVDDDALYPYRPESHLRDDITSIFLVKSWVQSKFNNNKRRCLPDETLFELRREQDRVNDAILVSVLDRFKQRAA